MGRCAEAAARAIVRYASQATRHRLRPLALGTAGEDPNDQLRGYGFRACWPDGMTIEESLASLQPPRREHFIGSYSIFLIQDFREGFRREYLVPALVWLLRQEAPKNQRWERNGPGSFIMAEAWRQSDDPQVFDLLGRIVAQRGRRIETVFDFEDRPYGKGLLSPEEFTADVERRRALFTASLRHISESGDTLWGVLHSKPSILDVSDVDWVWDKVETAPQDERASWFKVARSLPESLERIFEAIKTVPEVKEFYGDLFKPVLLGSEAAREMRAEWEKWQPSRPRQKPQKPEFDVAESLNAYFDKAEADPSEFWILHRNLICDERNHVAEANWLNPDVTSLPGWRLLDPVRQKRWTDLCRLYVGSESSVEGGWSPDSVYHPDVAGYRSLRWLLEHDPAWLERQDPAFYARWASAVTFVTNGLVGESKTLDERLLQAFYQYAPQEVARVIPILIRREARKETYPIFYNRFEKIWDERLSELTMNVVALGVRYIAFEDEVLDRLCETWIRTCLSLLSEHSPRAAWSKNPQPNASSRSRLGALTETSGELELSLPDHG